VRAAKDRLEWRQRDEIATEFRAEKDEQQSDIERCSGTDPRNGVPLFVFGALPHQRLS
jgi:hypothetical protein